jgi:hypothetical protein
MSSLVAAARVGVPGSHLGVEAGHLSDQVNIPEPFALWLPHDAGQHTNRPY